MPKQGRSPIDSVGWVFLLIVFAILLVPAIYLSWHVVRENQEWPIPVGMGVLFALFAAGIVAWIVNTVLQVRAKRRHAQTRKKAKKR